MRRIFRLFLGLMAVVACTHPAMAFDWVATARLTMIETTYAPGTLPIEIDQPAGSCAAGTVLTWSAQGATKNERIANYNATLKAFLAAQANGTTLTIYGSNAGCQINYIHKDANFAHYPVRVTDAGAHCDGATDDTQAIIKAIALAGPGGVVQFPAGTCVVLADTVSITLDNVSLVGSEGANWNEAVPTNAVGGTFISVGLPGKAPGSFVPFFLERGVTIRGMNFFYPYTIANQTTPRSGEPPLFSDDGHTGSGNILLENVHAIAPNIFWSQSRDATSGASPTYGNIRMNNLNVYAVSSVFEFSNIQEFTEISNFLSNPSICFNCSEDLRTWTSLHGVWFHVRGNPNVGDGIQRPSAGMAATTLVVSSYATGILIDDNGQMDESIFGPTVVWDRTPTVLNVNSNGSITHSVFSGKYQNSSPLAVPAFLFQNPQFPLPGCYNCDHNTISLNGFSADGPGAQFVYYDATSGDVGSVSLVGVTVRDYCRNSPTSAVQINAPGKGSILIDGSQFTYRDGASGRCGTPLDVTAASYAAGTNIVGYVPTQ